MTLPPSCTLSVPSSVPGALEAAADSVAAMIRRNQSTTRDNDVVVCLGPGIHRLHRPLKLMALKHNHRHGGRVVWRGDPEHKTTISGGAPLSKWMRCFDGSHCNS